MSRHLYSTKKRFSNFRILKKDILEEEKTDIIDF
jgi:hypothetical protein